MPKKVWIVDLTDLAQHDFIGILNWTAENFGSKQAFVYEENLRAAIRRLAHDPFAPPSRARDEAAKGLRTLHVPKPGRHSLLYRLLADDTVLVLRILHDAMDWGKHLLPEDDA